MLEHPDHLQPGAVTDVGQAGEPVTAEVALQDAAVRRAVEEGTPLLQLEHPFGSLLGVDLSHPPAGQQLPAAHRVAEMHLPAVLGVHVAEGGGDPAFRHHRVGLAEQRLADDRRARALAGRLDRRPQAGPAGADHDDVEGVGLEVGHQKNRGSSIVPVATRRTYRSVSATHTRLIQAICMWRALSVETSRQKRWRRGDRENTSRFPPHRWRQE